MSFVWLYLTILLFSKSSALNLVCDSDSMWIIDTQCITKNVEVIDENEHLIFEYKDKPLIYVNALEVHIKDKNPGFSVLPKEVFSTFPKLKVLWIMKSSMQDLSPENVKPGKELEALGLRDCKISAVESNTFSGFSKLKYLAMESNRLSFINRDTFTGLSDLTTLKLSKNQIHNIEDGAFNFPKLIRLDVSGNKLTTLSESIFSSLINLESIYLSFNELTHIGGSLYGLPKAANIGLDNNKIVDVDLIKFAKMPELYYLNLNNTGFSFQSQKMSDIENDSFKRLVLAENNLKNSLDLQKLRIFKGLEVLDLSGNSNIALNLPSINIMGFLPKLRDIKLQRTNLDCEKQRMLEHQLAEKGVTLHYDTWCRPARTCTFSYLC